MTPSIIRRFARYHGLDEPENWTGDEVDYAWLAVAAHPELRVELGMVRVVQSLTRIEDAEMLIECGEGSWSNPYGQGYRNAHAEAGIGLLIKTGIDPDKWREVRDEEA